MLYSSIDNKKIKNLKKLNIKKYRDLNNMFLIETEHLIKEAIESNCLQELLLLEGTTYKTNVETNYVTKNVIKYLTNLDSECKMIGVCKKNVGLLKGNRILVLDNIQDPGNLGTIIRTSKAFNIDTLILSKNTVDLYNDKVIRSSEGLIFKQNIIIEDTIEVINKLKKDNYTIYGTKVDNGKSLKTIEKENKFVIIMGNEGNGIKNNILDLCDKYIYIDMNESCESLNVAIATGIILYEFNR